MQEVKKSEIKPSSSFLFSIYRRRKKRKKSEPGRRKIGIIIFCIREITSCDTPKKRHHLVHLSCEDIM